MVFLREDIELNI